MSATSEPMCCGSNFKRLNGDDYWTCTECGAVFHGIDATTIVPHRRRRPPNATPPNEALQPAPAASGEPSDERSAEWRAGYEAGKGRGADVCRSRSASLASGQQYTASNEAGKCARAIEIADRGPDWLTAPAMTHEAVAALTESERAVSDKDCTRLMLLRRVAALRAEVEAGRREREAALSLLAETNEYTGHDDVCRENFLSGMTEKDACECGLFELSARIYAALSTPTSGAIP